MHSILEHHINGNNILDHDRRGPGSASDGICGHRQGFSNLEEIWGSEVVLSYPGLYAGQTDLVGVYQGRGKVLLTLNNRINQNEKSG